MAWGFLRTIPYLSTDGIDALRDAVLWGYGIYALLICLIFPKDCVTCFVKVFNRAIPFILIWLPIAFFLYWFVGARFSLLGGSIPFLSLKPGDIGVHLGAIAAFLLLRLDEKDRPYSIPIRIGLWILWWIAWILYGAISRGAMFDALLGMGAVLLVRPKTDWIHPLIGGLIVMGTLAVFGINIHVPDPTRDANISLNQVGINFFSLYDYGESGGPFEAPTPRPYAETRTARAESGAPYNTPGPRPYAETRSADAELGASQSIGTSNNPNQSITPSVSGVMNGAQTVYPTRSWTPNPANTAALSPTRVITLQWRVEWWKKIIKYTFTGPYFWLGKGFGIDLAKSDGIHINNVPDLRSPHNAFMTVLARSGVPGFALWIIFLAIVFIQSARMIYGNPHRPDRLVIAWATIYLLVLLFNSCFDVFLEGPMGGIWFWSIVEIVMLLSGESTATEVETLSEKPF